MCLPVCLRVRLSVYLCFCISLFAFISWPIFFSVRVRRRGCVCVRVSSGAFAKIFTLGAVFNRMSTAERLCLVFIVDRMHDKGLSNKAAAFSCASVVVACL